MQPDFFDNRARILKDDLVANIAAGDRVAIAASVFSMYAYQELAEQLEGIDELRFVFTSQAFTKQRPPTREARVLHPTTFPRAGPLRHRLRDQAAQRAHAEGRCDRMRRLDPPQGALPLLRGRGAHERLS